MNLTLKFDWELFLKLFYLAMILKAALNKEAKEYDAVNMLLVSLGLLKDENGKYKMLTDLRGPLSALKESISYFTPTQKQVLKAFMNRQEWLKIFI